MLASVLAVGVGGAGGALSRWGLSRALVSMSGADAAWATLGVNLLGCFAFGICAPLLATRPGVLPLLVLTGFLGAFTTFSAFAFDAAWLFRERSFAVSAAYIAASVGIGLAAFLGGALIGRSL